MIVFAVSFRLASSSSWPAEGAKQFKGTLTLSFVRREEEERGGDCARVVAHQRYVVVVSTKTLDVALYPTQGGDLVVEAQVSRCSQVVGG